MPSRSASEAQPGGVDGVERDPIGVGRLDQPLETPRRAVVLGAGDDRSLVELLEQPVKEVLTRRHRQPVADVEDRLATLDPTQRVDQLAHRVDRELQVVVLGLGELADPPLDFADGLRLVDRAQQLTALRVVGEGVAADVLEIERS